jgi:hypothetical protein
MLVDLTLNNQLQTQIPPSRFAIAPVPPDAQGLATMQSAQYTRLPLGGFPNCALVVEKRVTALLAESTVKIPGPPRSELNTSEPVPALSPMVN